MQMLDLLEEPEERLLANLEVLRVARFHIGFIEDVVPSGKTLLIARPGFDEAMVVILSESSKELQVVRGRAIVGKRKEDAGISAFDCLMKVKSSMIEFDVGDRITS